MAGSTLPFCPFALCYAATHLEAAGALKHNPCHGALRGCRRLAHGTRLAGGVPCWTARRAIINLEIGFLASSPGTFVLAGVWVSQHAAFKANAVTGALQQGKQGSAVQGRLGGQWGNAASPAAGRGEGRARGRMVL